MIVFRRLWSTLYPRVEFEQLAYRRRLASRVLVIHFGAMLVWLVSVLYLEWSVVDVSFVPPAANLAAAVAGVLVGLLAWLCIRRNRPVIAGYLLALVPLSLGTLNLLLGPSTIHFTSVTWLVSTVMAGAVIGAGAAFAFAAFASLMTLGSFLLARAGGLGSIAQLTPESAAIFLLSVPIASIVTAVIISMLSAQVQRTIDRLHSQAQRLSSLANTDPLTHLANRRYLLEQLDREFARARRYHRPLSLIYIDLDGFKAINDRHGHLYGDDVLQGAAKALSGILRTTDLLARIGGDEFAVLMPETEVGEADKVTDKLRRALAAYGNRLGGRVGLLSFCAGVATIHPEDDTIEGMLQRADEALYLAKNDGVGQTRSEFDVRAAAD
jgi:diguanylate cyclase (GGDEF)-like protein